MQSLFKFRTNDNQLIEFDSKQMEFFPNFSDLDTQDEINVEYDSKTIKLIKEYIDKHDKDPS